MEESSTTGLVVNDDLLSQLARNDPRIRRLDCMHLFSRILDNENWLSVPQHVDRIVGDLQRSGLFVELLALDIAYLHYLSSYQRIFEALVGLMSSPSLKEVLVYSRSDRVVFDQAPLVHTILERVAASDSIQRLSLSNLRLHGNDHDCFLRPLLGARDCSLGEFHLNYCSLDHASIPGLRQGLARNRSLRKFGYRRLVPHGLETLLQGVADQGLIEDLELHVHVASPATWECFQAFLRESTSLQSLQLALGEDVDGRSPLASILAGVQQSQSLKRFTLRGILPSIEPDHWRDLLRYNSTLESLDLFTFKLGPAQASAIAEGLTGNDALTELNLSHSLSSPGGRTSFDPARWSPLLTRHAHLQTLNLQSCHIGDRGLELLLRGLVHNADSSLVSLDIGGNLISNEGLAEVVNTLSAAGKVRELNLSWNDFAGPDIVALVCRLLVEVASLRKLCLDGIALEGWGQAGIEEALSTSRLEELSLSATGLGVIDILSLWEGLRRNTSLRSLSSCNGLQYNEYPSSLFFMLKENKTLQSLDLSGNTIGPLGLAAITLGLVDNTGLQELNLSDAEITTYCLDSIGTALTTNSTLQVLHLPASEGHRSDFVAFWKCLGRMKGLRELRTSVYDGFVVDLDAARALASSLELNCVFRVVDMKFLSVPPSLQDRILFYLYANCRGRQKLQEWTGRDFDSRLWPYALSSFSAPRDLSCLALIFRQKHSSALPDSHHG